MALGLDKSLAVIRGLKAAVLDGIDLVKGGINVSKLPKLFQVLYDLKAVVEAAPGMLPELGDLDSAEVAQLSAESYEAVKEIVNKIKS